MGASRVVLVVCLFNAACAGDDAALNADASVDGDGGSPTVPWLAEGAPPVALPTLTPCPTGWHERDDPSGVAICEPYPESGPLDCPDGEAHFVGEAACAPVGATCPAGDFADDLPTDRRVVYVRPGATGGDGSLAAPYGSTAELALGSLPMGTVIALSAGDHDGAITLVRGLALRGACAARTLVRTDVADSLAGIVTLRGSDHDVRDLTLADSPRPGVFATGAVSGHVEGVVVDNDEGLGIGALEGARLTVRSVLIRDMRSLAASGTFGRGIESNSGASIEASRIVIQHVRDHGASASHPGTELSLTDVAVLDTQGRSSDLRWGNAFGADEGALIRIERAIAERNHLVGVLVGEAGAEGVLRDVIIRDTEGRDSDGFLGSGIGVQFSARADIERVVIEGNRDNAVYLGDEDAQMTLSDAILRGTRPRAPDLLFGRGLDTQNGVTVDIRRVLVDHVLDVGVYLNQTTGTITDLVVRDMGSREADGSFGRGIAVQDGAHIELERALVDGSRDLGISSYGAGTVLEATDVAVRGVALAECAATTCPASSAAMGVGSYAGGSVHLTRFLVRESSTCGVHVASDGQMDLASGEVSGQPLGACIQIEGYDVGRLMSDVVYDNDTNLQVTSLPVPEPAIAATQ